MNGNDFQFEEFKDELADEVFELDQQKSVPLKYRALVANDDQFQLLIISSMLQECHFKIETAVNG